MEMNIILILISVVLLVLGVGFVIGEIESEEVDFFGPAALFSLVVGVVFWFVSNPISVLNSIELFMVLTIVILSVVIVLSSFSIFITFKMVKVKNTPTTEQEFIGGTGKTVEIISKAKEGYVKYKGELWKARSDKHIGPKKKVKIIRKDGLVLFVEPEGPEEKIYCANCGAELSEEAVICSECGTSI